MATTIASTVRSFPEIPYQKIQADILGTSYSLTLVFVGEQRAQRLNTQYRNKTYIPNVLSFPLNAHTGEVYITPTIAKREAKKAAMSARKYTGFLFIHGLLHLKGYRHGATMEAAEKRYLKKYSLQ